MIPSKLKDLEIKKETIHNDAVRICIECGSKTILINNKIYCKDCNSKLEQGRITNDCIL